MKDTYMSWQEAQQEAELFERIVLDELGIENPYNQSELVMNLARAYYHNPKGAYEIEEAEEELRDYFKSYIE